MNYEKAYKEALERAKEFQKSKDGLCVLTAESIFPELQESEDEKIRKGIIDFLWKEKIFLQEAHSSVENNPKYRFVMDAIAWLEKQKSVGEIVERCKNSWYNEGKIAGMLEGLTDDEKYQQGWHDALEKQGEQKPTDNVEPKFKVGDIVKFDRPSAKLIREILSIDFENERYSTRRTDKGGDIKEFIYFCEQDDYVIVGSHCTISLEYKVNVLADEIIDLRLRVKALELQEIKQCSDKNRLDSLESKMIILDSYNINNRLDALESSVLEEGK